MSDLSPSKVGQLGQGGALVGQHRFPGVNYISSKTVRSGSRIAGERAGKTRIEPSTASDEELIVSILDERAMLGRRRQSLATLARGMRRLARWCAERNTSIRRISHDEAREYRFELVTAELADASVLSLMSAGSSLCEMLVQRNIRMDNPFRSLKSGKNLPSFPRSMLKEMEWGTVLDRLARYDEEPSMRKQQDVYRAHVIAELLYASGMRIGEAALLEETDIKLVERTVTIREGKGGRERTAFLSDFSCRVLGSFLSIRPLVIHRGFGHRGRLFGMSEGNLSSFMSAQLAAACRASELAPVSSHCIRHMVGWHLLRAGASLRVIQGILGHLQLRSTEVYTRVDKESLRLVLDERHPRSGVDRSRERSIDETKRSMEHL